MVLVILSDLCIRCDVVISLGVLTDTEDALSVFLLRTLNVESLRKPPIMVPQKLSGDLDTRLF